MKVQYDVQPRTDGPVRKDWFRKELEPCEWKLSCTVLRGKGFVRIWTTRCLLDALYENTTNNLHRSGGASLFGVLLGGAAVRFTWRRYLFVKRPAYVIQSCVADVWLAPVGRRGAFGSAA